MNAHSKSSAGSIAAAFAALCGLRVAGLRSAGAGAGEDRRPTLGTIERLDPRFDQLVPPDARVERIAEGFDWSEGPVWDRTRKLPASSPTCR